MKLDMENQKLRTQLNDFVSRIDASLDKAKKVNDQLDRTLQKHRKAKKLFTISDTAMPMFIVNSEQS